MRKYFQWMYILGVVLVFCYVLLVVVALLLTLLLSGVRVSPLLQWVVIGGWVVFCFGSVYVQSGFYWLRRMDLRKPIAAEAERLEEAMEGVLSGIGVNRRVTIWIEESPARAIEAIGRGTIVLSKGLLDGASAEELRGVLAQAYGHLMRGDTILKAALMAAGLLPRVVGWVLRLGRRFGGRINWKGRCLFLLGLGYLLYHFHLLAAVIFFAILDWFGAGLRGMLKKLEREYGGNFAGFE